MKELNANLSNRTVVHAAELEWQDSPMAGVSRRMLDGIGDEVARATTIVRYVAGSHFSPHVHTGGEEFVVLEGAFQDERELVRVEQWEPAAVVALDAPGGAEVLVLECTSSLILCRAYRDLGNETRFKYNS